MLTSLTTTDAPFRASSSAARAPMPRPGVTRTGAASARGAAGAIPVFLRAHTHTLRTYHSCTLASRLRLFGHNTGEWLAQAHPHVCTGTPHRCALGPRAPAPVITATRPASMLENYCCSWFPVAPHLFLPDLSCPSKRAMLRVVLGGLLVATAQVRSCLGGEWARRCVRASGAPATFPAAWARRPGREVAEHPRSARELTRVSTRRRFRCRLCPRSAAPRVSGLQFRACLPPPAPRRSALCVPLRV